jgi:branched-chain amino acid transport system substrate-binding protein
MASLAAGPVGAAASARRERGSPSVLAIAIALLIGAGPGEIRIGVVGALETSSGTSMRNGARLAAAALNARGGVLGRRVVIVERDDRADPQTGLRAVKELVDREQVLAIIGPTRTVVARLISPEVNRRRIPLIIAGATGSEVNELFDRWPDNYVFRYALSDPLQASLMVREAIEVRRLRRPAILSDASEYGTQGRERLLAALAVRRVRPVASRVFPLDVKDPRPHLEAARAANADVLLLFSHAPQLARVVRALERMRWRPAIVGCWTLGQPEFLDAAGPYAEGAVMPRTIIEEAPRTKEGRRFVASYRAAFGAPRIPEPSTAAQGHDAVHLLASAMTQAGSTEPARVKAALESLRALVRGATGRLWKPFSRNDHDGLRRGDVTFGVVRAGRVRPAPPPPAPRRSRPRRARRGCGAPPRRRASRRGDSARDRGTRARRR